MTIKTAVILASGFGTRMLPITAGVQKELMPILGRPVIDYIVRDCVVAGITRVVIVVRPGETAIRNYYEGNEALISHLKRFHKSDVLAELDAIHRQADFEFVEQPATAGYGTAIPVRIARPYLPGNEAIVAYGGDDFLYHADGSSETARLIETFHASGGAGALSCLEYPESELSRFGIIKTRTDAKGEWLADIIEKPAPGAAPSNLANVSKYILTPAILDEIDLLQPDEKSGEYYITKAIAQAAQTHPIAVHRATGRYLDTGNLESWFEANLVLAAENPQFSAILNRFTIKS